MSDIGILLRLVSVVALAYMPVLLVAAWVHWVRSNDDDFFCP